MSEQSLKLKGALAAEERKLLACVHCGLCLEACPTYVQTGDENDSPRGRIYLMRAVEEERLKATSLSFTRHIDRCLGCRACESACPAGVEYGQLLEAARADIAARGVPQGWTNRALRLILRHVWLHRSRLRMAFTLVRLLRDSRLPRLLLRSGASRLLPRRMELALALLDGSAAHKSPDGTFAQETVARDTDGAVRLGVEGEQYGGNGREEVDEGAGGEGAGGDAPPSARRASLFTGCVMEGLFARVNRATARVLAANGCEVGVPRAQVCCGALHAHAGDLEGARLLARQNIEAFDGESDAPIVTNAGGCGAMLLTYGHLLAGDERYAARAEAFSRRVRDVSQQLDATGIRRGASLETPATTTYDASCHLLHGQRANLEPLALVSDIPALKFVPLEGSDVCCGGAGLYNLLETELSARVLDEKLARIRETGAQLLSTGNPGCHMQIAAGAQLSGLPLRVCHPVELLDESYKRAGFYSDEK